MNPVLSNATTVKSTLSLDLFFNRNVGFSLPPFVAVVFSHGFSCGFLFSVRVYKVVLWFCRRILLDIRRTACPRPWGGQEAEAGSLCAQGEGGVHDYLDQDEKAFELY